MPRGEEGGSFTFLGNEEASSCRCGRVSCQYGFPAKERVPEGKQTYIRDRSCRPGFGPKAVGQECAYCRRSDHNADLRKADIVGEQRDGCDGCDGCDGPRFHIHERVVNVDSWSVS